MGVCTASAGGDDKGHGENTVVHRGRSQGSPCPSPSIGTSVQWRGKQRARAHAAMCAQCMRPAQRNAGARVARSIPHHVRNRVT